MSVLVKGMKMPENCLECRMTTDTGFCSAMPKEFCGYADDELNRPKWCPLVELPKGEWLRMSDLSEKDDNRYKCSRCGNVIHYKSRMYLYTFNSWCGRCGSDNSRHTTIIEGDKREEDAPTVIETEDEG